MSSIRNKVSSLSKILSQDKGIKNATYSEEAGFKTIIIHFNKNWNDETINFIKNTFKKFNSDDLDFNIDYSDIHIMIDPREKCDKEGTTVDNVEFSINDK